MTLSPEARAAIARRALPLVDLTNLADGCTANDVHELWHEATTPFGPVAAVCIWPRFIGVARDQRRNDPEDARAGGIAIATVMNFPSGDGSIDAVVSEARTAVQAGADEIDLVMPYRAFLAGDEDAASAMIRSVGEATGAMIPLKVILETGSLGDDETIARASRLAIDAGADFLKTSTGKTATPATPQAARVMLEAIRESGRRVGLKPSGGIRTIADAAIYLALADEIMGEGWANRTTFRFGASGLLGSLIDALGGDTHQPATGH
jgi:deoxyribose-phosphate aldolase